MENVFNFLMKFFETKDLRKKLSDRDTQIKLLYEKLGYCSTEKTEIANKLQLLENETNNEWRDFWNNKKPRAKITYSGRTIPEIGTKVECDIRLFLTPLDFVITNDITRSNLKVGDPNKCDVDIIKIFRHTRTKKYNPYRYKYDEQQFKISELWMFPFELRKLKEGDCEDWAHELASYLIAAGVPNWRVRVVCGTTWSGFGHSTVYVLGDDMATWRHLNSTNPIYMVPQEFSKLPKSGDPNDKIGIKHVWFSFNDVNAWHTFETSASRESFKKEKIPNFIKIRRK